MESKANFVLLVLLIIFGILVISIPAYADDNFGENPPPSHIWTDKDHYNVGDTITVYGKTGWRAGMVDVKVGGPIFCASCGLKVGIELPNGTIKTLNYDLGNTTINTDGTFSTSFVLSNDKYFGSGTYMVSTRYVYGDSFWEFTVGNIVNKLDQFQLVYNQTVSDEKSFAMVIPDNEKENYTFAVRNGNQYYDTGPVITRVTDPEGLVTRIDSPYPVPDFSLFRQCCNTIYGTWKVQTTWGDNISTINVDVPRHAPRLDILLYGKPCPLGPTLTPQYSTDQIIRSETMPCITSSPSYDRTNPVQISAIVTDKVPNQVGFTYQILNPTGNIVMSKDGTLTGIIGTYRDPLYGNEIVNPNDNIPGVETSSGIFTIPTDSFPNIGGNYTIKINYQGITQSKSFHFDATPIQSPQLLNSSNSNSNTTINHQIPNWVKNNAKWWSKGQLGDSDFEKGIQYLIDQKIINIPPQSSTTSGAQQIPAWVKNTAGVWASGTVSDDDFLKGIEYLVRIGIIKV